MIVYLDLIILENVCMNFLILFTTGKLLKREIKRGRIFVASLIGTLYVFSLYWNVPSWVLNISKIMMSFVLAKIAFYSKKLQALIKEALVILFVSFVFAGCTLGIIHCIKPKVIYIVNGIIIGGDYIFEAVLVSAVVSYAIIKLAMRAIKLKSKLSKNDMLGNLLIEANGVCVNVVALLDTGNLLTDPITGDPVVIVERKKIEKIIPKNLIDDIEKLIGGDANFNFESVNTGIRFIPYMSLGNKNGIIPAFKVDQIKLEYQDEVFVVKDVLIGIFNDALTKNDKYSALIGLHVLERSNTENEYNSNFKKQGKYSVC